jgi:hypothetical protein
MATVAVLQPRQSFSRRWLGLGALATLAVGVAAVALLLFWPGGSAPPNPGCVTPQPY